MIACPKCQRPIPEADVNVGTDVAFCRACQIPHSLARLVQAGELAAVDLGRLPAGVWRRRDGQGWILGASSRSWSMALGALAFGLFWNGIVSVFVLIVVASTLSHLGVPLPDWFPAPEMNGEPMGVGMTIFLWIFLTPFIAVGLGMVAAFLAGVAGKTEIQIRRGRGSVFTGVGVLGLRQRFNPESVVEVRLESRGRRDWEGDPNARVQIVVEEAGGRRIRFGSSLPEERRRLLAAALHHELNALVPKPR